MREILQAAEPKRTDSYSPDPAANCPLPLNVGRMLRDLVLPGSAAGRVATDTEICPIPLTGPWLLRPSPFDDMADWMRWRHTRGPDILTRAIADELPKLNHVRQSMIRRLLADHALRTDCLPYYLGPGGGPAATEPVNDALSKQRGAARVAREIVAAVAGDLEGRPLGLQEPKAWIIGVDGQPLDYSVSRLIGLKDHCGYVAGELYDATPGRARKYVSAGRKLLGRLGAWPWAHAPEGRLPQGWRTLEEFLTPLEDWQARERQRITDVLRHSDEARSAEAHFSASFSAATDRTTKGPH